MKNWGNLEFSGKINWGILECTGIFESSRRGDTQGWRGQWLCLAWQSQLNSAKCSLKKWIYSVQLQNSVRSQCRARWVPITSGERTVTFREGRCLRESLGTLTRETLGGWAGLSCLESWAISSGIKTWRQGRKKIREGSSTSVIFLGNFKGKGKGVTSKSNTGQFW